MWPIYHFPYRYPIAYKSQPIYNTNYKEKIRTSVLEQRKDKLTYLQYIKFVCLLYRSML